MGTAQWLLVFGLILFAWAALFVLAVPADLRSAAQLYGADFWDALCTVTLDGAGYANAALMWALMAAAMMLPSALPAFATHDDLGRQTGVPFLPLVLGYGCVWIGFAVTAAALQLALYRFGLISAIGDKPVGLADGRAAAWRGAIPVFTGERGLPCQMPPPADIFHAALG
jgi:predicted metal-binding membrane protein